MKNLIAGFLCFVCVPAFAAFPVLPVPAEDQAAMVESGSPELAANKRVSYDLYRVVMAAQLDLLENYAVTENFTNHNPNEESGFEGMKAYLQKAMGGAGPKPLSDTLPGLLTIFAEGDMVILAFAREYDHPTNAGEKYTSTWFDMFRVKDGLVVEHWDAATIRTP
jgi:predicted SnoaL-like aldol condensation-catalyzing enzyme